MKSTGKVKLQRLAPAPQAEKKTPVLADRRPDGRAGARTLHAVRDEDDACDG